MVLAGELAVLQLGSPLGQVRDTDRGLCRCMIDYNFDENDVFHE